VPRLQIDDELAAQSRHLVDLLTTLLSSTFRRILWKQALELDLNYSQAQMLFHVARHPGALVSDAARSFGITLPAVTQLVDRLEAKGFLERAEDRRDRRQVHLYLTRDGERLARGLEDLQVRGLAEVLNRLSSGDRKEVIRGIERLVSAARGEA
jgi:DNA-binding MarR family transcriptional regulator